MRLEMSTIAMMPRSPYNLRMFRYGARFPRAYGKRKTGIANPVSSFPIDGKHSVLAENFERLEGVGR